MKQITFELLRHGPPHNQLLSPLTPYLALCENHPATSLQIPFEHNQFLHRLRALAYQDEPGPRAFQARDTARTLGDLLGGVPGLVAGMNRGRAGGANASHTADESRAVHLRMVLSASELALLPFELALSPAGFPGAGQPLLLQLQNPVCLTREVRRVAAQSPPWPGRPKVLFIAASPAGAGPIPFEEHLAALRNQLEPWANYSAPADERHAALLHVLPQATCEEIEQICSRERFTHVHILAHGIQYEEGFDVRFGLALHDRMNPHGPADAVSGERLATALCPVQTGGHPWRPLAVTIASCDSARQGGVLALGGSAAHALHLAGIPFVAGSQFPLSTAASLDFVNILSEALLWATDPRIALNTLRRRLHTLYPDTHDWASITAYAALPENLESWLAQAHRNQTCASMEAALSFADFVMAGMAPGPPSGTPRLHMLAEATARMEEGRRRLDALFHSAGSGRDTIAGKLAATEKRCAQAYFYFSALDPANASGYAAQSRNLLNFSRRHYWDAFELNRHSSWALVQFLSLDLILRRLTLAGDAASLIFEEHQEHTRPSALWTLAHTLSLADLHGHGEQRRIWALGNLAELHVLLPLLSPPPFRLSAARCAARARGYAAELAALAGAASADAYFLRRQLLRYQDWYGTAASIAAIEQPLAAALSALPPVRQY
ncbi:MAG: CHAT domain-containing protein [Bryobacterales bacterium]|nr:CHAT domain-containing protein [Bryobacterales bacterium]